jgi:hypothetical protein
MNSLLTLALALTAAASPLDHTAPSYAGAWTLDLGKSTGLPDYYSRVKSHKLSIAQNEAQLKVEVTVDAGFGEPDKIPFAYALNGVETKTETSIRGPGGLVPVPTKLTASQSSDGHVHINITRIIAMGGPPMDAVTTEEWSMSADGSTLTVHRIDDTPRGHVDGSPVARSGDRH